MRRTRGARLVTALLLTIALMMPLFAGAQAAPDSGEWQRVIVGLRTYEDTPEGVSHDVSRRFHGRGGFVYEHVFRGFAIELPSWAVPLLARDPRVAFVEPDLTVQTFAEVPTGIDRIEADQNPAAGIDGTDSPRVNVDVAVIDTGIGPNNDLNIAGGAHCTATWWGRARCTSGGYADDHGHGTHVAGTIGALDNGSGVVGVAPGARLWAVKALDANGNGSISAIIAGIDWVVSRGDIEVINMSLGAEGRSTALDSAINNATSRGIVVVVAAGNDGKDAQGFTPASSPRAITVSAMVDYNGQPGGGAAPTCGDAGPDDSFAFFSNYGSVVDIAAPGVCITSTLPNNRQGVASGTSMATPHVAGAAALYIASKGVASSSSRWSTVLNGLRDEWSVPQASECGFTGGKSSEPMLLLAPCAGAGSGGSSPTTGTVSGTVTDSGTGDPIPNATVSVDGTSLSATTDGSGSYQIPDVPQGDYTVTASAANYQNLAKSVTVTAGGSITVDFSLTANPPATTTGTITGKVTDASNGQAVSGATVSVDGTSLSTTTDPSGNYQIADVPEGSHSVTASAEGFQSQSKSVSVTAGATSTLDFSLTPNQQSSGGALTVEVTTDRSSYTRFQTQYITVRVTDGTSAVSGASVDLTITGANRRTASSSGTTGRDGTITFTFRQGWLFGSGTYRAEATASKDGYTSGSGSTTYRVR